MFRLRSLFLGDNRPNIEPLIFFYNFLFSRLILFWGESFTSHYLVQITQLPFLIFTVTIF